MRAHSTRRTSAPLLGNSAEELFISTDDTLAAVGTTLADALTAAYLEWTDGNLAMTRDRLVDTAVVSSYP